MQDLLKLGNSPKQLLVAINTARDNHDTLVKEVNDFIEHVNDAFNSIPSTDVEATPWLKYSIDKSNRTASCTGIKDGVLLGADIKIAEQVDGYPVTAIADDAFAGNTGIESVEIPTSIKHIGEYAFRHCIYLAKVIYRSTLEKWNTLFSPYSSWTESTAFNDILHMTDTVVYCLDGQTSLSGTKKSFAPYTKDINEELNENSITQINKEIIPSLYSVAYAIREAMPVYMSVQAFAKGKTLYPSTHSDYNKLIYVGNVRGWNMTAGDNTLAISLAKLLDRGYIVYSFTKGLYNPLITHVEFSSEFVAVDGNVNDKVEVFTLKLEIDAAQQDNLMIASEDTGGFIWLHRQLPYYSQPYYPDDTL